MMAYARLALTSPMRRKSDETSQLARLTVPEVRRLLEVALPLPARSAALRLDLSAVGVLV